MVLLRLRAGAQPGEVVAEPELLPTLRGCDGVGAVAVHPEQTCFAVAEKRREGKPTVSIYSWPGLQVRDRLFQRLVKREGRPKSPIHVQGQAGS